MSQYVLYSKFSGVGFGSVAFERDDLILVDEITPNTCFTPEMERPMIVRPKDVIERGDNRYHMADAMLTANRLSRPEPSQDAIIAAARKRLKECAS